MASLLGMVLEIVECCRTSEQNTQVAGSVGSSMLVKVNLQQPMPCCLTQAGAKGQIRFDRRTAEACRSKSKLDCGEAVAGFIVFVRRPDRILDLGNR